VLSFGDLILAFGVAERQLGLIGRGRDPIGQDDRHLSALDGNGVALAAIQGLNQKLTEELKRRDAENAELKRKNDSLEQRLEALEKVIGYQRPPR